MTWSACCITASKLHSSLRRLVSRTTANCDRVWPLSKYWLKAIFLVIRKTATICESRLVRRMCDHFRYGADGSIWGRAAVSLEGTCAAADQDYRSPSVRVFASCRRTRPVELRTAFGSGTLSGWYPPCRFLSRR